jgi:hypothetical protein
MEPAEEHQTEEGVDDEDTADKSDVEIITERPETEMVQPQDEQYGAGDDAQQQQEQEQDATQMNGQQQGFGFNQNQQGFGNMDFSAMNGFNPMMAMQNGMGMPGFGMGMPNMMGKHQHSLKREIQAKDRTNTFSQACPVWPWTHP